MTIEEKLKHFYDTSVDEARRQAEKDVREHKEALDAALEEHKKMSLGNAASSRKAEIANAKREINKALSAEQLLCGKCLVDLTLCVCDLGFAGTGSISQRHFFMFLQCGIQGFLVFPDIFFRLTACFVHGGVIEVFKLLFNCHNITCL